MFVSELYADILEKPPENKNSAQIIWGKIIQITNNIAYKSYN